MLLLFKCKLQDNQCYSIEIKFHTVLTLSPPSKSPGIAFRQIHLKNQGENLF